jgi:thiol:disulfide interchange protein DsbD
MTTKTASITIALFLCLIVSSGLAEPIRVGHVQAELVTPSKSIQPGRPFMVGLHLIMDEHWHVYWRNPGDAGIPPSIDWQLPDGFKASNIQWPAPERFEVPPLTSYGYHHDIILPVLITPPDELKTNHAYTITAKADWLVCKVECIPGSVELSLALPAAEATDIDSTRLAAFEATLAMVPTDDHDWQASASVTDDAVRVMLTTPRSETALPDTLLFLPYDQKLIVNSAPQRIEATSGEISIEVPRSRHSLEAPEVVDGILFAPSGSVDSHGFVPIEISAPVSPSTQAVATTGDVTALWQALLFALLGGMILNLMPCVLPVLSLKVLSFVKQAGDGNRALGHGLLFTGGVLVSFWALAGVLLLLQAGGEQLGWGFQLQSPAFLIVLSGFMFLFGLNLFGVFEVGNSLTGLGSGSASQGGGTGSFIAGVTATIVATPCTAPFMGSALGFSLSQPWWAALTIFTFLGLGMAAPYVVLSAWPALLRFVPKPGAWMETLKQALGFILMATVIWLAWVLSLQTGSKGVLILMAVLLVLGIAGWVLGRFTNLSRSTVSRRIGYAAAALLIVGSVGLGISSVDSASGVANAASTNDSDLWQTFSPDRVTELRAEGRPVFIDFTAAWCLSCQVNKRVALRTPTVEDRFQEARVVPMVADWTSRDEIITRALAEFGRNSVPLYVLYPAGIDSEPVILPEILTEGIVLEALEDLNPPTLGAR